MGEKRRDERLGVVWRCRVVIDDVPHDCEIGDVSTAGTLIISDISVELGKEVLLDIPEIGEFAAVVAWVGPGRFGLELQMGPDMLLKKYAELSNEYPSTRPADVKAGDDPLGRGEA